jgi:hypothetical protein
MAFSKFLVVSSEREYRLLKVVYTVKGVFCFIKVIELFAH